MNVLRRIAMFWVDFIVGDALEVALVIFVTLAVLGLVVHQWRSSGALGFALLAVVIAVTWLALLRATAAARR